MEKKTKTVEIVPLKEYVFQNHWNKEEHEFFMMGADGVRYLTFTTSMKLVEKLKESIGAPITATFDVVAYNKDFDAYRVRNIKF